MNPKDTYGLNMIKKKTFMGFRTFRVQGLGFRVWWKLGAFMVLGLELDGLGFWVCRV